MSLTMTESSTTRRRVVSPLLSSGFEVVDVCVEVVGVADVNKGGIAEGFNEVLVLVVGEGIESFEKEGG